MKKFGFEGVPSFPPEILKITTILKLPLDEVCGKRHDPKD
jgi:hypothetical protein